MASRGWEHVKEADIAAKVSRGSVRATTPGQAPEGTTLAPKPSKYRNVAVVCDGVRFHSQREANHWLALRAREAAGEITDLQRQVTFPLYAPAMDEDGLTVKSPLRIIQISSYIADYTYRINGLRMVVDAKGRRVCPYPIKAKWLNLQQGIEIVEV